MGGRRQSRTGRNRRTTRPTALLSAVATLLAALFVCLGTGPEPRDHHGTGAPAAVAAEAVPAAVPPGAFAGAPAAPHVPAPDAASARDGSAYICPYDSRHCGVSPHLSPAVLSAPPPATPVAAEPQHLPPPAAADPVRGPGVLPRAPGRHVLQVMRT
ncbi:hypothetical protein AR457_24520 [Streptomyces agglomeratus]|uniref:Uncharacterized protein n=1 Tax=Streptomyces agglomeratus TaxID=285458 RepID=A0A1E5PC85_9ACTN|nr:hypothetical protein [Streptomyces agglomeratus]OEJ27150.1 hypothetical protein AS594_24400 [Streptomyces agglomeratus]OEJ38800.1 hypothetical protein BGK70_12135 [Streptomyces agglomeratus]OEJ46816.1 hypothetical protein AR457_24520 [Streptomyces agglomeratus]OEJ51329.1 hypothetical protein BGK72_11615 [Streptomyces agglomeratus]OEJ58697.1 hypothetical protein BGM19_12525 [Streptomyces agglomeratus]